METRTKDLLLGVIFGGWIGLVYSYCTMAFNWMLMPGIPLKPPQGGAVFDYILTYILAGAAMGLVCTIPKSFWLGVALGGVASALFLTTSALFRSATVTDLFLTAMFGFMYTFLPTAVLMMPASWLIRLGVNAQHIPADQPELWARKVFIPVLVTLVIVGLGAFSIYNRDQRDGFHLVNRLILENRLKSSSDELPASLRTVQGFLDGAQGPYALSISDDLENFMGPQPVAGELSQFLVVADFESGLRFACIFQGNVTSVPYCTNF